MSCLVARGHAWLVGSIGTLVYEMRPETSMNDLQDAYIKGTSVSLVVLGLLYFLMVRFMVEEEEDG